MTNLPAKIFRILRSPRFFAATLLLFALESVWIAVSAAYPGVFDENVHFTIIKLYAHQWSPFFPAHATYTDPSGAVVRDPSYLYHYLMSFPYRLLSAATKSQTAQIIILRLANIVLFGSSLVLFRRLLLRTKASPAVVHAALLFFVLTPMVPLLASEINYDNLIMPVTALALLMATSISDSLVRKQQLPIVRSLWLLVLCLLGSLVQFEFLPVFGAIFLWLGWQLRHEVRAKRIRLSSRLRRSWLAASWQRKLFISLPVIIAAALFLQMYGLNLVRYHDLTPTCGQVLTSHQCSTDGTWIRAQQDLAHKKHVDIDPLLFTASWAYRLLVGTFYTSSGGASPQAFYLSINPLPIIFVTALLVFGAGTLLAIKYWRDIINSHRHVGFLLFTSLLYAVCLWLRNYHDYVHLGEKVAINGRYLLPVMLPLMLVLALAFGQWLRRKPELKLGLLLVTLLLFSQGGGALTYIVASNGNWYWRAPVIVRLNRDAQAVIKPLVLMKAPIHNASNL